MNLRDYVRERIEKENSNTQNILRFKETDNVNEIVEFYRTYDGPRRKMRPLDEETVKKHLIKGDSFVGAYLNNKIAGIVVSKLLPENYPYFTLPKEEEKGNIYMLGGLYVHPLIQGLGIATKLSKIITQSTENYGRETGNTVGMGYEVSYDNEGSLNILSQYGNYIGYYSDEKGQEGLSVLLYRPFNHEPVNVERPEIQLSQDEETSKESLNNGLEFMSKQTGINGISTSQTWLEDGNKISTTTLNNTAYTIPEPTFEFIK